MNGRAHRRWVAGVARQEWAWRHQGAGVAWAVRTLRPLLAACLTRCASTTAYRYAAPHRRRGYAGENDASDILCKRRNAAGAILAERAAFLQIVALYSSIDERRKGAGGGAQRAASCSGVYDGCRVKSATAAASGCIYRRRAAYGVNAGVLSAA